MKKIVNGKTFEMTQEEVEALKALIPEEVKPTVEERLEELTACIEHMKPLLEKLTALLPGSGT